MVTYSGVISIYFNQLSFSHMIKKEIKEKGKEDKSSNWCNNSVSFYIKVLYNDITRTAAGGLHSSSIVQYF